MRCVPHLLVRGLHWVSYIHYLISLSQHTNEVVTFPPFYKKENQSLEPLSTSSESYNQLLIEAGFKPGLIDLKAHPLPNLALWKKTGKCVW